MALIACPECKHQVSDKAPACPQCGAPIAAAAETAAVGVPLQTIQGTAKELKGQLALAALFFWGGIAGMFLLPASEYGDAAPFITTGAMLFGFVWYIATRIRIWWHHS